MKPGLALIAAAAVALGAGGGTAILTPFPPPTDALLDWVDFPADASPRPILWLYPPPTNGYGTGENKLPAYCYSFAILSPLPASFPATGSVLWPDGTSATYPGISADRALDGLAT
ncbi:MAG TPA: hypothetical protein VNU19_03340, partial [Candidatus Acidoferrum sp.]|nr:hypothetical protein [Candidatus Acidoferrum sp.]